MLLECHLGTSRRLHALIGPPASAEDRLQTYQALASAAEEQAATQVIIEHRYTAEEATERAFANQHDAIAQMFFATGIMEVARVGPQLPVSAQLAMVSLRRCGILVRAFTDIREAADWLDQLGTGASKAPAPPSARRGWRFGTNR